MRKLVIIFYVLTQIVLVLIPASQIDHAKMEINLSCINTNCDTLQPISYILYIIDVQIQETH